MRDYRDLRPDDTRPVQVRRGDFWYLGEVQATRRTDEGRWQGWVRWHVGVGQQHIDWVDEADLERVDEEPTNGR